MVGFDPCTCQPFLLWALRGLVTVELSQLSRSVLGAVLDRSLWSRPDATTCCRFVAIEEVEKLLETFTAVTNKEAVCEAVAAMDLFGVHDMDYEEFAELLDKVVGDSSEEQLTECLSLTLQSYFLSMKDRDQQIRCTT
jgi:hypothetical protein